MREEFGVGGVATIAFGGRAEVGAEASEPELRKRGSRARAEWRDQRAAAAPPLFREAAARSLRPPHPLYAPPPATEAEAGSGLKK